MALTWFEELERVLLAGMTPSLWSKIQTFFESEVPRLVLAGSIDRKRRGRKRRGR